MVSLTLDVMLTSTAMSSKPRRLCKGKGATFRGAASSHKTGAVSPAETPLVAVLPAGLGHGWHCHQQHQHHSDLPLGVEGRPGVEVEVDADARQEPQGHPGERQLHDPQPAGTARGHHEWALSPAPPTQALPLAQSHCSRGGRARGHLDQKWQKTPSFLSYFPVLVIFPLLSEVFL